MMSLNTEELKSQFKILAECFRKHGKLIKTPLIEPAEEELPIDFEKKKHKLLYN
jgi:hypothetical protein